MVKSEIDIIKSPAETVDVCVEIMVGPTISIGTPVDQKHKPRNINILALRHKSLWH